MNGRQLNAKPNNGIYIQNGQKYIAKWPSALGVVLGYEVDGTVLALVEDAAQIFADDAKREQLGASEE